MAKIMKEIIVIKIGSSVFMTRQHKLDMRHITHIAKQVLVLKNKGFGIVLVISGAVAHGSNFIDLSNKQIQSRKAAAGIGQMFVSSAFNSAFGKENITLAQILLTKDSLKSGEQKKEIKKLIEFYLESDFVSFINENDVLDLNSFGGNDHLAAEIAKLLKAKKLLILSTWEGSLHGVGGGDAKQKAVSMLSNNKIEASIVNGKTKDII